MSKMEKHIFETKEELQSYLTSIGFTIANGKMTWDNDTNTNNCYWTVAADGKMNFRTSASGHANAFYWNIVDFDNNQKCGVVFIELAGGGCALYLTPLPQNFPITDLTLSCANNYDSSYQKISGQDLQNGLVVCSPAESDDYWRYSWRDKDPLSFAWTIDDCQTKTLKGQEIPMKKMTSAEECISLIKVFLDNGEWSENIFVQVLGESVIPGSIFKMNGQKYISFTDNLTQWIPCFRLPPETVVPNDPTSTQPYSEYTTYQINDYCTHNGYLFKCIRNITTPKSFDSSDWIMTTVYNELNPS